MNRYFVKLMLLGVALFVNCTNDPDVDGDVAMVYGEDLSFTINTDLSCDMPYDKVLPEGEVGIFMSLESGVDDIFKANHEIVDGCSEFTFEEALPQGLHVTHMICFGNDCTMTRSDLSSEESTIYFGTTLQVDLSETYLTSSSYSKTLAICGEGTYDSPYEIASSFNLAAIAIYMDNNLDFTIGSDIFFKQTYDLDFSLFSSNTGRTFDGLCKDANRPFMGYYDGRNKRIDYLNIVRFNDTTQQASQDNAVDATGLFCYVAQANIKRVKICKPTIIGYYWVGALVGAVVQVSGSDEACTNISECYLISDSSFDTVTTIYGRSNVGGLVGGVDDNASLNMFSCANQIDSSFSVEGYVDSINCYYSATSSTDEAGGFCGGLVGGTYLNTTLSLDSCSNSMDLTAIGSTAIGGLVGGSYNLNLSSCTNSGDITGVNCLGVGGLAGGAMDSIIAGCENTGNISGDDGVGGVLGSSANNVDNQEYGSANCVSLHNTGSIYANKFAGGLAGSAQVRFVNCYNEGRVESRDESAGGLFAEYE